MIDLSNTPLTTQQIAVLSMCRVSFYIDPETGQTFVSKRYWNGINQAFREALARVAMGAANE